VPEPLRAVPVANLQKAQSSKSADAQVFARPGCIPCLNRGSGEALVTLVRAGVELWVRGARKDVISHDTPLSGTFVILTEVPGQVSRNFTNFDDIS